MGTCRLGHLSTRGQSPGGGEGQTFLGAGTLEMQLSGALGTEKGGALRVGSEAVRGLREGGCSERGRGLGGERETQGLSDAQGRSRLSRIRLLTATPSIVHAPPTPIGLGGGRQETWVLLSSVPNRLRAAVKPPLAIRLPSSRVAQACRPPSP